MDDGPVPKQLDTRPDNLPLQLNRFIGREREVTALRELLMTTRLITLTGAGAAAKRDLPCRSQLTSRRSSRMASGGWTSPRYPIPCSCRSWSPLL